MQPTARSLILDLLSTLRRGSMPVRALVEAGALLGIAENNIRVSLARLFASGRVQRDERGRYRLGPAAAALGGRLQSWRDLGARTRSWQGDWIAVHRARRGRGPDRRRCERALDLLGFRELEAGFALRPDNLRGGIAGVRHQLLELAGAAHAGHDDEPGTGAIGRVFRVRDLEPASDREARGLWDAERLAQAAHEAREALLRSERRLPSLSQAEAMQESFLVGGGVLRLLSRHPLLPEAILDPEPLESLLDTMKRYDRLGRDAWARFLASHDVPHRALPLDSSNAAQALLESRSAHERAARTGGLPA